MGELKKCKECGSHGKVKTDAPSTYVRCEMLQCDNKTMKYHGIGATSMAEQEWNHRN